MIRSKLIALLSKEHELSTEDATHAVDTFFGTISDALADRKRVELRGFGVFIPRKRNPRRARNPRNGKPLDVPEKYVPRFKTGRELRTRLNNIES